MKNLLAAASLIVLGLTTTIGRAQSTAPDFPTGPPAQGSPEAAPSRGRGSAKDQAREQARAQMTPEEAKHDEQMAILEARTGNTSFSRSTGPDRQLDGKTKGFTVRKFKDSPGAAKQERGMTHDPSGAMTQGKPLVHHHKDKRKWYLRF